VRAMLCLGRQENHMRYRPPSRRTATSKHVPRGPPRTGLFLDFTQPAAVWASGCSGKATALVTRNPTSASNRTMLLMGVPSGRVAQALAVCNVRQGQGARPSAKVLRLEGRTPAFTCRVGCKERDVSNNRNAVRLSALRHRSEKLLAHGLAE